MHGNDKYFEKHFGVQLLSRCHFRYSGFLRNVEMLQSKPPHVFYTRPEFENCCATGRGRTCKPDPSQVAGLLFPDHDTWP